MSQDWSVPDPPPPNLIQALQPTAAALHGLADAGQALAQPGLPDPASQAMAEIAAEADLPGIGLLGEPVESAHSVANLLAFAATDHLRNFARLFEGEPVPVFSHLVLTRACLDAAGVANWLGQPSIGVERRAQRYVVHRLANAKQMKRSPVADAKAKAASIRQEVGAGCLAAGWALQAHMNDGQSPRVGDEEQPTARQAIAAVLGDPVDDPNAALGDFWWWLLSGVIHGTPYGLMQSVRPQPRTSDLQPPLGAVLTDSRSVVTLAWAAATAYRTMTESLRRLFGRASAQWDAAVAAQEAQDAALFASISATTK